MLGTLAAAVVGPQLALACKALVPQHQYAGSFLLVAALCLASAAVLTRYHAPATQVNTAGGDARPLAEVVRQPAFLVAVAAAVVAYSVMSFIMTATPISMHVHDLYSDTHTAWVIQSHVLAMYAPSLVSGRLIARIGIRAGMLAGLAACLYYMLAPRYIPFAFYESSSFISNATQEAVARYEGLRQSYYLADESTRAAALAAWEEAARPVANWWGVKRDFAALFAVPIGLLTMIGVSLFTPAPSRDVQSFVEELRREQAA